MQDDDLAARGDLREQIAKDIEAVRELERVETRSCG